MQTLWVALVAGGFTVLVAIINRADKATQKQAVLDRLGITADEAALLLG